MSKHAKEPRVPLNLRVGAAGKASLARIAEWRSERTGKKVPMSDVARDAFGLLCPYHDALVRIADRRTIVTGQPTTPLEVAHAAMRLLVETQDPERQTR